MSSKNVAALIIIAAVAGFILGRNSYRLGGGVPGPGGGGQPAPVADAELAPFLREDPGPLANDAEALPVAGAPFVGPGATAVTIVEFSDFQCPYCRRVGPTLEALLDDYGDDVRLVFRHLPLSFHERARPAAIASLAAHRQGKFWEFHDEIFSNFGQLSDGDLEGFAEEIGLDMDQFRRDLEDEALGDQVDADMALARRLDFGGTPSFSINGREVVGAQPEAAFREVIDAELEAVQALLDDGVPLTAVYARRVHENLRAAEAAAPEGGDPR